MVPLPVIVQAEEEVKNIASSAAFLFDKKGGTNGWIAAMIC
jgi:hypothetical protein